MRWDYLIVGAGFSGAVLAERLSTCLDATCLVVDRRDHIGGNAFDSPDATGVLLHRYGPHYFRTNNETVLSYLSRFTDWRSVTYKVLVWTDGRHYSFPINLTTFEQLMGRPATEEEFRIWLSERRVPIEHPSNSEEVIVSQVGYELYRKFFEQYTLKQWGRHPRELDASVCGRIPVRVTRDDRYLNDRFQAMPAAGYTAMFERILGANPRIEVRLRTDFREVARSVRFGHLVYTGAIDEYYDGAEGVLAYRSLRFEHEPIAQEYFQPGMQVNYPNDHAFTRIIEIKHATGQRCPTTTITREYPEAYAPGRERYYPVPTPEHQTTYARYAARAARDPRVTFVGRLGRYVYCNMDQAVEMALSAFEDLAARRRQGAAPLQRIA